MLAKAVQLRGCSIGTATYGVIIRVAISPKDMGGMSSDPRIPSSQPVHECQSMYTLPELRTAYAVGTEQAGLGCKEHTSDDPTCADRSREVASIQG